MQRLLTGKVRFPGFEGEWEEVKVGIGSGIKRSIEKCTTGTMRLNSQIMLMCNVRLDQGDLAILEIKRRMVKRLKQRKNV